MSDSKRTTTTKKTAPTAAPQPVLDAETKSRLTVLAEMCAISADWLIDGKGQPDDVSPQALRVAAHKAAERAGVALESRGDVIEALRILPRVYGVLLDALLGPGAEGIDRRLLLEASEDSIPGRIIEAMGHLRNVEHALASGLGGFVPTEYDVSGFVAALNERADREVANV